VLIDDDKYDLLGKQMFHSQQHLENYFGHTQVLSGIMHGFQPIRNTGLNNKNKINNSTKLYCTKLIFSVVSLQQL
jgi:hypothetical protein